MNYCQAYNLPIGLLINFGAKSLEFKRVYNVNHPEKNVRIRIKQIKDIDLIQILNHQILKILIQTIRSNEHEPDSIESMEFL